jgi:hypothetical protein
MILFKKYNANNHQLSRANNGAQWSRPVELAGRANSSDVKLDRLRPVRLTFFEDFILEHSLNGVHITSIEVAGIF